MLSTDKAALAWAGKRFPFGRSKLMSDRPWGRTWRLNGGRETAYLKALPKHLAASARATELLAEHFAENLPGVIAADPGRGLLLMRDHGGRDMGRAPPSAEVRSLIAGYGHIQARAAKIPAIIKALPAIDLDGLWPALMQFLHPASGRPRLKTPPVSAEFFLGADAARRYFELLEPRTELYGACLKRAGSLAPTVNHCDLRTHNAAVAADGGCFLYDWDEAVTGPAGISLHALFSGCSRVVRALGGDPASSNPKRDKYYRGLLRAYQAELVKGKYADAKTLAEALPGAALAGVIRYVLSFAQFPQDSKSYRRTIDRNLRRRLDDLLALGDYLLDRARPAAFRKALKDHRAGRLDRAVEGYERALKQTPGDAVALANLGEVLRRQGKAKAARARLDQAVAADPGYAGAHIELGHLLAAESSPKDAAASFKRALALAPDDAAAHAGLGGVRAGQGRTDDAIESFRRARAADPDNAKIHAGLADAYLARGKAKRAVSSYERALRLDPENSRLHADLGDAQGQTGKLDKAAVNFRKAITLEPDDALARGRLGNLLLDQGRPDEAVAVFERALEIDPDLAYARESLDLALKVRDRISAPAPNQQMPSIRISTAEAKSLRISRENLVMARTLFDANGCLHIENALAPEVVRGIHQGFVRRYSKYFKAKRHADALRVGDKRYMITLDFEPPFDDPAFYANPLVLPILRLLLGANCILGSMTSVLALPGSKDQRLHKDHPALFQTDGVAADSLPAFAVTLIVPLVELNDQHGTTRMVKGSHLRSSEDSERMPRQVPYAPLGSCMLMDYRVSHQGTANVSRQVRPILTSIYQRPWFRDYVNFEKQPMLRMTDRAFEKVPQEHRSLFDWTRIGEAG